MLSSVPVLKASSSFVFEESGYLLPFGLGKGGISDRRGQGGTGILGSASQFIGLHESVVAAVGVGCVVDFTLQSPHLPPLHRHAHKSVLPVLELNDYTDNQFPPAHLWLRVQSTSVSVWNRWPHQRLLLLLCP